jgi:hypothetical protein
VTDHERLNAIERARTFLHIAGEYDRRAQIMRRLARQAQQEIENMDNTDPTKTKNLQRARRCREKAIQALQAYRQSLRDAGATLGAIERTEAALKALGVPA